MIGKLFTLSLICQIAQGIHLRSSDSSLSTMISSSLSNILAADNICGKCCDAGAKATDCQCPSDFAGSDNRCCLLDYWNKQAMINPDDYQFMYVENNSTEEIQMMVTIGGDGGFDSPPTCLIGKVEPTKNIKQYFKLGFSGNLFPYSTKDGDWSGQADHVVSEVAFFSTGTNFDISIIPDGAPGTCLDKDQYAKTCSSHTCFPEGGVNNCACANGAPPCPPDNLSCADEDKCNWGAGQLPQGTNDCHTTDPITPYWTTHDAKIAGMLGIVQSDMVCDTTCPQTANNCEGQEIIPGWVEADGVNYNDIAKAGGYRSGMFGADACYNYQDCLKKGNNKTPLNFNTVIFDIPDAAHCQNAKWPISGILDCLAKDQADPNINRYGCMVAPHDDWKNVGCLKSFSLHIRYCDVGDLVCDGAK